ncbi:ABC transporter ATP-binding protein [Actinomyces radicidentis]|uniref:ABC transporter ATP-binding protein n=1 Tax=Actinomyces radicidentis TaxID=111015 RepID=A0A0X8JFE3_ACTRD|nr:ABC transporter ATP-binding protein [Actinomyces radicidentis]AMD87825.1 ABC transporter ATP-binding protein [Actinomyces radicidentis]
MNQHEHLSARSAAPGAGPAVRTHELTRTFGTGARVRTVVDRLSLDVPRGCVYGFLGPNGAGKSTTMKMLLGLLAPTSGEVSLLGTPLTPRTRGPLMARTGSMIEQPPGYGHLTGAENMRIMQRMLGLSDAQVDRALALVRLTEHKDKLVREYSLGMKQRLGIALALARDPELLVLDEPTNGLDPAGIEEVRHLLVSLAGEGVTVMVSSHLLDEIDRTATVLGILAAGRLVFQGSRAELMARSLPAVELVTPAPERVDADLLAGLVLQPGPAPERIGDGLLLPGLTPDAVAELCRRLVAADVPVHELRRRTQSLEDVFMDLTGGAGVL